MTHVGLEIDVEISSIRIQRRKLRNIECAGVYTSCSRDLLC